MKSPVRDFEAEAGIIPVPIRPDITIKIHGVPFDLTGSEANKIANVILAMASPGAQEGSLVLNLVGGPCRPFLSLSSRMELALWAVE